MRIACPIALAFLLAHGAAAAPILPSLFDVTGVSTDDVLNVRAAPDADAPVIGSLAPGATGIEVVALDPTGRWGEVNVGETAGWAALRYLAERPDVWKPGALPASLACSGTEPFWTLRVRDGHAGFEMPDARRPLSELDALGTGIPGDVRRVLVASDAAARLTATITPQSCGDGMSDRAFALSAMLVVEVGDDRRLLTGCCSIAP